VATLVLDVSLASLMGDMNIISDGIIMWLTISMLNGEPEKKTSNMEATVAELLQNTIKHHDASPK
jgi:hypothetical protein